MKKMLLAATAAAVVGGVAVAGSPVQAQEAEGFQLQIGGFYNALAIVRDNDDVGGDKIRSYDFNQRGRYTIQGSQTLDNGMTVGFHTQYEMQDNMSNNRAYVYADGGFGRVQFGTMYSAPYLMHVSPPTAGWGIDDTGHSQGVANVNGLGFGAGSNYFLATAPYYINRAMSFTYMTPRFAGIQAGFTFAPDQQNEQGMNNRVATNLSAANRAGVPGTAGFGFMNPRGNSLQNLVGVGLNYQQSFDEFSVALSAGAETGTWNQNAENYAARVGFNDKRAWTYALGANVGFGGLNAGVAYNWDNMGMSGLKTHQITTGLTYTVDGFTFGPSFGSTWQKGNQRPAGSPRTHIYEFGARYAFAPGVNLVGSLEHAQFKSGINANDGDATAGLFGVQMNF